MEQDEKKLEPIFSVSEYIEFLNINLRKIGAAKITGEVTRLTVSSNGHVYFSIKDKSGKGVLDCIIWKNNYALCGVKLEEGKEVVLSGHPDVYLLSGRFSFKANTIELKGEGALKKAYEEFKNKLEKEGIFDLERKKKIPMFPERIGVITSKQGAVIHDFLNNIGKYGFKIQMIDSRVEGQEAIKDLLSAIRTFKKKSIDVLVVIRGGGSLESLQPFNNEALVKEIVDFPIPIIAGIGHDKDAPLFTLAADVSESTPTAVANLLNESWEQAASLLEGRKRNVIISYENILESANLLMGQSADAICGIKDLIFDKYKEIETALKFFFQAFKNTLQNSKSNLKNSRIKSVFGFNSLLSMVKQQLEHSEEIVNLCNPDTQLKLGYSIARCGGRLIRSIRDTKIGEDVDIRVADGTIISKVKKIAKN
ncbi:MAG: exodeoxyribonuclease VII large subunit [bacterium]